MFQSPDPSQLIGMRGWSFSSLKFSFAAFQYAQTSALTASVSDLLNLREETYPVLPPARRAEKKSSGFSSGPPETLVDDAQAAPAAITSIAADAIDLNTVLSIWCLSCSTRKSEKFHIVYFSIVDAESQCGPLDMPALIAAGSGIDVEKIAALVILHEQYVGMPADEDVGPVPVDEGQCLQVIVAGPASDMLQKDFPPFALEASVLRIDPADILAVTVAVHGHQRLEGSYRVSELKPASEVPGVPKLVDRR